MSTLRPAALALWSVLLSALALAAESEAERPNVVLILSDDQAWTDYGFMGHEWIETPHLDELAAESLTFTAARVPSSLCRPSLMTFVTGLYPHQHGVTGNDPPKGAPRESMLRHLEAAPNMVRLLREEGYHTLQTGKWWEGDPERFGFSEAMTHGDPRRGGRHGDEGLVIGREGLGVIEQFLDQRTRDQAPFFIWYAPFLPHTPHNPSNERLERYRAEGRSEQLAKYGAMCSWLDDSCGELLELLEQRQLTRETLVVFVADNGWQQDPQRGAYLPRSKRSSYDGGVRTPMLFRWPGRIPPSQRAEPVSTIDLVPTILDACDLEIPATLPGTSLLEPGPVDRPVFGARFTHDVVNVDEPAASCLDRWVARDRWKLILPTDARWLVGAVERNRGIVAQAELYDVVADPGETTNLAERELEVVARLTRDLETWWRPEREQRPPHLLLIVTDDQRADALSCAGHPILETPHMDALAARGTRFENAFVTTAICASSRASFLTSQREGRHGFTFGTPPLAREFTSESYPALLNAAGYQTHFVGKWGMKTEVKPAALFDSFRSLSPPYIKDRQGERSAHLTDLMAEHVEQLVAEYDPARRPPGQAADERPLCITVSFNAPHAEDPNADQYIPPPDLATLWADAEPPRPPLSEPEFFASLPEFQRDSMSRDRWFWRFDDEQKRRRMTLNYWRMIAGVDRSIGRMLAAFEEAGLADETVIVLVSDNGYFLGERGWAGKWSIHELSIRVPLIVVDPRVAEELRGQTRTEMALALDVPATLLDAAGVELPESWEGHSLLPLSRGEQGAGWRRDFLYEHGFNNARIPKSRGVRTEHWTYVEYYEQEPPYEELYDLRKDPLQARNLARDPDHAGLLEQLRARRAELAEL